MGIRRCYRENKKTGRHERLAAFMIERTARKVVAKRNKDCCGPRRLHCD